MRSLSLSLLVLAALVVASTARADELVATLEVTHDAASERCLDREDLVLRVASRLGRDPFLAEAPLRFRVSASRAVRESVVLLEMFDAAGASLGSREWRRGRCDAALRAEVALALTLLIREAREADPVVEEPPAAPLIEPTPIEPPPVAEPTTQPAPQPAALPNAAVARRTAAAPSGAAGPGVEVRFELAVFAVVLLDVAPLPAAGVGLDVGLRIGEVFSVGLEGRFDIPVDTPLSGGGRVETSIVMGGAYACGRYVYVGGCVIGAVGALRATGQDLVSATTATTTYATAGARVFGEYLVGPVMFQLRFDVLPAIVRTSLEVSGDTVWSLPAVSFAVGGGVGAIF
jgi:hypothetical protein